MPGLAHAALQTVMVANIWGEPQHLEETISTLRFASRVRTLTTGARFYLQTRSSQLSCLPSSIWIPKLLVLKHIMQALPETGSGTCPCLERSALGLDGH